MIIQPTRYGRSLICKSRSPTWITLMLNLTSSTGVDVRSAYEHWNNLNYLKELPELKVYSLGPGLDITSAEGLESQKNLKSLSLGIESNIRINWECFQNLEDLFTEGRFIDHSMWHLQQLKYLAILNCNEKNWSNFSKLKTVESIRLIGGVVQNFLGLDQSNIKEIEILKNRRFSNFCYDCDLSKIEKISVSSCPSMQAISGIEKFPNLKEFNLIECGSIDSIKPLLSLEKLEKIDISGTRVMDGKFKNVSELPSMKSFYFNDQSNGDITLHQTLIVLNVDKRDWPIRLANPKKWNKIISTK